jgi:preprotein translocase subunit SecG
MSILFVSLHVLAAVALIGLVLIHRGEGANMGVSFGGGGAQTLFGSRGSGSFLGKLTGAVAGVFMLTSLTLAFFSQQQVKSVVDKTLVEQPVQQENLPAADGPSGFDPSKLKGNSGADGLPTAN